MTLTRTLRTIDRKTREVRLFVRAMKSGAHPVLANLVVCRRCNLSCTYCNQYDKTSPPVARDILLSRIARLQALGTSIITFTGGEPLLHPDIPLLVRAVRQGGSVCILNTNGYLLTEDIVRALNEARLDHLFISVDNLNPNQDSVKSLKVIDRKLEMLARLRTFAVTVNSVLGSAIEHPEEAYLVARRAEELGFNSTVGLAHRDGGELAPLSDLQKDVYRRIQALKQGNIFRPSHYDSFQNNLVEGKANDWHCPGGGRFLYVCEDGLVHYCSQQRGTPGIPLTEYGAADIEREGAKRKECAPYCTISCVHQTAFLDRFRTAPSATLQGILDRQKSLNPGFEAPWSVRLLEAAFISGRASRFWRKAAAIAFGGPQPAAPPPPAAGLFQIRTESGD